MAAPQIPPDAGTDWREHVTVWDNLWKARYKYASGVDATDRREQDRNVDAAPGYTRSFSRLVAGLFQRQSPSYVTESETVDGPYGEQELSELLEDMVARAAGYGTVLLRPVYDGVRWTMQLVAPTRFAVTWAHRRPQTIVCWDHQHVTKDRGLMMIETWTADPDGPGRIVTEVWETEKKAADGGRMEPSKQVNIQAPPDKYAEHPFVLSAQNDDILRRPVLYVWAWEDFGPVPLWYTAENVVVGLARLWDQEQDDAEMTRKRVAMPEDLLGRSEVRADGTSTVLARPGFRKNDNILLTTSGMTAEHGANGGVTPIEFSDDLVQRERIERRENSMLELVGINPASIGRNVGGRSDSAAAKRADNQMTMNTITAPARRAETALSAAVTEVARLNSPMGAPVWEVSVHEGLKENPAESADVAKALRDADAASTFTLVQTAHPTWTQQQVEDEVARMEASGIAESFME